MDPVDRIQLLGSSWLDPAIDPADWIELIGRIRRIVRIGSIGRIGRIGTVVRIGRILNTEYSIQNIEY